MSVSGPFGYVKQHGRGVSDWFEGFIRETTDIFNRSTQYGRWFAETYDEQSFRDAIHRLQQLIDISRYTADQKAEAHALLQKLLLSVPRLSDFSRTLQVIDADRSARTLIWGGTHAVIEAGNHYSTICHIPLTAQIGSIRRII